MNWNTLNSVSQLDQIDTESKEHPVLIYKHSTRCGICTAALSRLERKWQGSDNERLKPYYLDLLQHRNVSNEIASRYSVHHESPQVLVIRNGKCVYSQTHMQISYDELMSAAA